MLNTISCLAYPAAENGSFCINCVLFGVESTHNVSKLQRLTTNALRSSASDFQKLCQHSEKSNVQESMQELIEKNRSRLLPIIDCIITCGCQRRRP